MLAVVALVVDTSGRILLHKREKEPQQNNWELFGTYVRPGERLIDAVKRKLHDDAGVQEIISCKATGKYYDEPSRHPDSFCVPLAFVVTVNNTVSISPSCTWFTVKEATSLPLAIDNNQILADNIQYI